MPFAVTAETQTSGRGRSGKSWQSPTGGAWLSVAWPIVGMAQRYARVPLVAASSVYQAIIPLLKPGFEVRIKWPNDILIDGKKVCGVLCEQQFAPVPAVVIGIGINVNVDPMVLGRDLRLPATSLHLHSNQPLTIDAMLDRVIASLDESLQALERLDLNDPQRRAIEADPRWLDFSPDELREAEAMPNRSSS
jgi:BirA family biotin operon repressor/biotin-[acetyl-CoA-carboxylase] ligase